MAARIPLLIFAVSRLVDTVLIHLASGGQTVAMVPGDEYRIPVDGHADYWTVIANWDGQWYRQIAEDGFPDEVPRAGGSVEQNSLIFLPLFPWLVRVVMTVSTLPFGPAATVVSVGCAAVGICVVHRLVAERMSPFSAAMTITALCFHPAAPALQIAYAEGLALLLLGSALLLLRRRRYGSLAVVVLLLGLTRAITLPLTAVVLLHGWLRHRRGEPWDVGERPRLVAATVAGLVGFLAWPLAVAVRTGELDAYFATRGAWIPTGDLPASWWQEMRAGNLVVVVLAGLALVALAALVLRRRAEVWPVELRAWCLLYGAFILVATGTGGGVFRYSLLLVLPWWPLARRAGEEDPVSARVVLVSTLLVVGVASQWLWIDRYLVVGPGSWGFP